MLGSFTGAVAFKKVTEACDGGDCRDGNSILNKTMKHRLIRRETSRLRTKVSCIDQQNKNVMDTFAINGSKLP